MITKICWFAAFGPIKGFVSTEEQIDANRRNGSLSNGPKTLEGKAASSKNAIKHGLLSDEALLPGEDKGKFEQFAGQLRAELGPQGELELALVERVIGLLWRLRRIGKLEAGVLFWHRCLVANPPEVTHSNHSYRQEIMRRNRDQEEARRRANAIEHAKKTDAFELAATGEAHIGGENSLAKLSRYETSIQRNLLRMLHELQRLQAARKGQPVPAPQVVDIDVTGVPELPRTGD
jgi:hypothetical protein